MFEYLVRTVPHWILLTAIIIGAVSFMFSCIFAVGYWRLGDRLFVFLSYVLWFKTEHDLIYRAPNYDFKDAQEVKAHTFAILGLVFAWHKSSYPEWTLAEIEKRLTRATWCRLLYKGEKRFVYFQPEVLVVTARPILFGLLRWLERREARRK